MKTGLLSMPEAGSDYARQVDGLYLYLNIVSVFFTILVFGLVVFFAVHYRRKSQADRPTPTKDNKWVEIVGSVIPFILVMSMFVWGARLYFSNRIPPPDSMEILVTGKQWMWKIQHPNGKWEENSLHVPAGVPVKLTMTSLDVIHNLFLPEFRIKHDVLPGRYTTLWFNADKLGTSHMFCAEYCGTEHSKMRGTVTVMPLADYQRWVAGEVGNVKSLTPIEAGTLIFKKECAVCHDAGKNQLGPSLKNAWSTSRKTEGGGEVVFDENHLRESLDEPNAKVAAGFQPVMTSFKGKLNEAQISQIAAYLKSIGPEPALAPAAPVAEEAAAPTE